MPLAPIDIHAHFYPEELIALWREEGPRCGGEVVDVEGKGVVLKAGPLATNPLGPRFSDLDARLEAMDEQGVAVHALSLSLPMVYWADKALAQKLSECYNDAAATAFLRHPDRFLAGTDTWMTSRWDALPGSVTEVRSYLSQLPRDVAEKIAFRNAERLFP